MAAKRFKHLVNENLTDFIKRTTDLLAIEQEDDIAAMEEAHSHFTLKQLQEKGLCLRNIEITEIRTGLYGRTIVVFAINESNSDHKFTVGDIVQFADNKEITGVICKSFRDQLKVAINDSTPIQIGKDLVHHHKYSLLLLIDTVTYKTYSRILTLLSKPSVGAGTKIRDLLFTPNSTDDDQQNEEQKEANFHQNHSIDFEPINPNLNESQLNAISHALSADDVFLIHGPPGTGKTTTICEFIAQSVLRGKSPTNSNGKKSNINSNGKFNDDQHHKLRILACAPSNIAVDNMVEKLSSKMYSSSMNCVRIGHPARILDNVLKHCLESLIRGNNALCDDIRKEIRQHIESLSRCKSKKERYSIYDELKTLRKELRKYETKLVEEILNASDVVFCTLTGAARHELKGMEFDLCIIDEAAQSLEIACWIPMIKCKKVILCGDHLQLPPTVKSPNASELAFTLFDKLHDKFRNAIIPKIAMLDTQYRMNQMICSFFSDHLYEGRLKSHESVAEHTLSQLEYLGKSGNSDLQNSANSENKSRSAHTALMIVDSSGLYEFEEDAVEDHSSKSNHAEAEIVSKHVEILKNAGIRPIDIAVISPYRGQVKALREWITDPLIEIGTVDGFQGREKEAIIVSFVRSNDEREIGFLRDDRRTNVAITRARRHCCLFMDSDTLSRHSFLRNLVDYCYDTADVRTADEYMVDDLEAIDEFVQQIEVDRNPNDDGDDDGDIDSKQRVKSRNRKKKKKKEQKPKLKWVQKERPNDHFDDEQTGENKKDTVGTEEMGSDHGDDVVVESQTVTPAKTLKKFKNQKKGKQLNSEDTVIDETESTESTVNESKQNIEDESKENTNSNQTISEELSASPFPSTNVYDEEQSKGSRKKKKAKRSDIQYRNGPQAKKRREVKKQRQIQEKKRKKEKEEDLSKVKYYNDGKIQWEPEKADLSDLIVDVNAKRCYFKGCKKKVHLIKTQCRFCSRIFCMKHGPLFHSDQCAKEQKVKIEKKKKEEIKKIEKMQEHERNGTAPLSAHERKLLADKLRDKVKSAENKRKPKSQRNKQAKDRKKQNRKKGLGKRKKRG